MHTAIKVFSFLSLLSILTFWVPLLFHGIPAIKDDQYGLKPYPYRHLYRNDTLHRTIQCSDDIAMHTLFISDVDFIVGIPFPNEERNISAGSVLFGYQYCDNYAHFRIDTRTGELFQMDYAVENVPVRTGPWINYFIFIFGGLCGLLILSPVIVLSIVVREVNKRGKSSKICPEEKSVLAEQTAEQL